MKRPSSACRAVVDQPGSGAPHFRRVVVQSVEEMDIDAWLDRYIRAIAAAKSTSLAA